MATNRAEPRRHGALRWFPFCALAVVSGALADVQFEPAVSVGVARTDNITLAEEDEQAETIYQLIPEFSLIQQSARLTTTAGYRMEGFHYDELDDSEVYHVFDGELSAAVDPENFFIELGASRSQSIRDPRGPIPHGNLPISGNRVDRDDAYLGPAFQYPLGTNAAVTGSYRRNWVRYDDDEPVPNTFARDVDSDTLNLSVDNYRRERGFTWAARVNSEKTDYGIFVPWEYRQATVELGGWVAEGLRVFGSGGKESAWDQPFDPSLEDGFWEIGFAKSAGEQFRAEFAAGERSFGSSLRGSLDLGFNRGSTRFSYIESPTTQERNPYDRGGLLLPDEPDDFLSRAGSGERYISERLQWDLLLELRRTALTLTVFDETRADRIGGDGTPLGDEVQSGANLTTAWRLGARTELRFEARRISREFDDQDESDLTTITLGAGYDLGPRTFLTLDYTHSKEDSDPAASGRNYSANLLSFLLTRTF